MDKQVIEKNPVLRRAFDFSLLINKFSERPKADKRYTISRQLLRSGTSVCANAIEAQDAESMADFIHTFKVAAKEGEETAYCLLLCEYSYNYPETKDLLMKIWELNKIIGKISSTSRTNKE